MELKVELDRPSLGSPMPYVIEKLGWNRGINILRCLILWNGLLGHQFFFGRYSVWHFDKSFVATLYLRTKLVLAKFVYSLTYPVIQCKRLRISHRTPNVYKYKKNWTSVNIFEGHSKHILNSDIRSIPEHPYSFSIFLLFCRNFYLISNLTLQNQFKSLDLFHSL